jgi:hypothetical protein
MKCQNGLYLFENIIIIILMGYLPNSTIVENWNNLRQFTEDLIELRTLWNQGKLFTFTSHCKYQDATHTSNRWHTSRARLRNAVRSTSNVD